MQTFYKTELVTFAGGIGAIISYLIGGITAGLIALCILMILDIILGFINALVFKKSKKTKNGKASSKAGIRGITRKLVILLIVAVAHQMDVVLGVNFIKDGAIVGYASMEVLSIIENVSFMGIPIPKAIKEALEIMNKKSEEDTDKNKKDT